MTVVLIKRGTLDVEPDTGGRTIRRDGGEDRVTVRTETGIAPHKPINLGLPAAGSSKDKPLPYRFQREQGPVGTLISDCWSPDL